MNPYTVNLVICLGGSILWIFTVVFMAFRIAKSKKQVENGGTKVEKPAKSYYICIAVCGLVCALPFLVLFKPYITGVLEGCGVLGTFSIMKERFEKINPEAKK